MATIFDVARKAGVSKSTVSLVLNNSPLVKEKTKHVVQEAIKEMGYIPNANARGLTTHHTYNFGVLVIIEDQPYDTYEFNYQTGLFTMSITNGILEGLADTEYGLVTERWCASNSQGKTPRLLTRKCIDGLFVVGSLSNDTLFDQIKDKGLPVVAVGRDVSGVDSVFSSPGEGAALGMSHLYGLGHKCVCYLNAPRSFRSSTERTEAVEKVYEQYHVGVENRHMVYCGHNTGEGGYNAVKELWNAGVRFDGIVTANDITCMGALRFCYEHQLRVPEDVSLVAYDDSVLCGYASPALTAVNISKELAGKLAAGLMMSRLGNPSQDIQEICVPISLVERASVKDRRG
jgi:DNA-binding LacI/PurR family transcriptional regulator